MFNCKHMIFYLALGACLAGAGSATSAGLAEPVDLIETVPVTGLDLGAPGGVALLHHRIALAARKVCAWADAEKRMDVAAFAECVSHAMRQASQQANATVARTIRTRVMLAGTATRQ